MTTTLPQAMGDLLPTDSPSEWRAAVHRAAQLLAPSWPTAPAERAPVGGLAALGLILYALHLTHDQDPAAVPVRGLRDALDSRLDIDKEPYDLKKLVVGALREAGHQFCVSDDVMCRVKSRLLRREEPPADVPFGLGGGVPGPSELRFVAASLKEALSALDEETAAALPPAPEPAGPVSVTVTGQVCVVTENSKVPMTCTECQQSEGAKLTVDGDRVTYTCTMGHASISRSLGAEHVRRAIDRAQAAGRVDGPLHVMHADLPADADLASCACGCAPKSIAQQGR
ncbi:hypothetical protein ABZ419_02900 [Streptomyces cinnamoneus]|uniref:hypothetical protein n=1 Tax=Streptomyces cinnamoneus TaxID=53446 RepID=UPI00340BB801